MKILRAAGLEATPLGSGCEMSEAAAEDVLSTRLATSRSTDLFGNSSRRGFRSHPLRERRWRWNAMRATRHARARTRRARGRRHFQNKNPTQRECWEQDWRPVDPRICLGILRGAGSGATPSGSGCGRSEAAAEDVLSTRLATSRSKDLFGDSWRRGFRSHPLRERRL